ncbi:type II CAAX endopeptidase family protein [Arenibacter sp. GZD96]|uniref:CPBP family intramembrane glutamic endopeptidase n=1 Tax=Aurantibrevibacter litoralis TaxID=3106030 RepID=UPI002AFE97FD|nr:type II CAAX endopeptidase family protein [Arenibacter sp. GZD-96]MEA1786949.1 type II CAAX endopeptidase family protein [Arenibacter sp. GZD-96]
MSYPKISIKEALLITIILIASLYGTSLISFNYYGLKLGAGIATYVVLIFYCNKSNTYNIKSGIVAINRPIRSIPLVSIIAICLFCFVYSIQIVLNALVFGDTFSAELNRFTRGFKTAVFSILLFPILEELLFRKGILHGLTKLYSIRKSIIVSSLLFSLAHLFTETGMFSAFLIGMVLGYIYVRYNSFILVLLVHIIYNLLTIYVSQLINDYIFAIELSKIYIFFIPLLVVSLLIMLGCIYLLNSQGNHEN